MGGKRVDHTLFPEGTALLCLGSWPQQEAAVVFPPSMGIFKSVLLSP